ncbi:DUF58 domain-containing protein, partial [bacterium]|nr:DUF58 domain-containing protein [bacterium]
MPSLSQSRFYDPRLFAKVANLQLIARTVVEGMISGRHKSPFRGFSVEFSEYRKYTQGDDLKHIDWKVLAKSDKIYVKEFEAETNLRAYMLLDVSGSMGYGSGKNLTKLEYASYCLACLAYLMIRQQDAVGLVAFDDEIRSFLAPRNSPQHLRNIVMILEDLKAGRQTNLSESFHRLAERIHRRGLILVFSDFLDDPERIAAGLAHFRHKRHEVVLFHLIDPEEEDFSFREYVEFEDLETGTRLPVHARLTAGSYRQRFKEFLSDVKRRCAEINVEHVPLRT